MTSDRRCGVRWRGKRTVVVYQSVNQSHQLSPVEKRHLTKRDVTNFSLSTLQAFLSLQLQWRVIPEEHLRRILDCSPSRIYEFLQENLSKDPVRFIREDCAKDDRNAIVRGFDVDSLLVPVVNCPYLASFSDTLRCSLARKVACLLLQSGVFVKCLFEWRSHGVAFQQADSPDQVVLLFLRGWQVFKINLNAEVIALLRLDDVWAIFALEHGLGAVCYELGEALHGN